MRISIFGLGYVGAVTAGCLASEGHQIIGIDVHAPKVDAFNEGRAPIIEPKLDELLRQAHANGLLQATLSCEKAITTTEASLICVGTPSAPSGALDLSFVRHVVSQIADVLRRHPKHHALIFRSTMLPGSTARIAGELLKDLIESGRLKIFSFPEFLREGTAVDDFQNPVLTVVGTRDGEALPEGLAALFGNNASVVDWNTAELIKYACNAFHAAKITFANEIGRLGKHLGLDAQKVMHLLCQDHRLNISAYYLRPGNPFGGSCLPKDVRALTQLARQEGIHLPLLESLLPSNERHSEQLLQRIKASGQNEIIILGLSFKANTDDLRESAMVEIAQNLLGRGFQVRIFDPQLNLSQLIGSNKRVIDEKMPHLASLLHTDLASALGQQGLIVAAQRCVEVEALAPLLTPGHQILDVNGWPELRALPANYEGFCW
ncbi:MAG: nucleotide sugar dehydrogenase [Verrucomicrobiota bacterium]